jgi:TPR repeat protein
MNSFKSPALFSAVLLGTTLLTSCLFGPTKFETGLKAFESGAYDNAYAEWTAADAKDDASAQNGIGWIIEKGLNGPTDPAGAAVWYKKAALQNHDGAMLNLGNLYDSGVGVNKDHKIAAKWFADAAFLGNAEAQNNLGRMYQEGHGVEKDLSKAAEWLERAAQQGFAPAQNSLGLQYFRGLGVPLDVEKALFWLELATLIGQEGAELNRDFVQTFVDQDKIEAIKTDATRWYPRKE